MWEQSNGGTLSKPANNYNNSQTCSQENQHGCEFEDDVFHSRVVSVLDTYVEENTSDPLFLFWASHACHGPLEVPESNYDKFAFIPFKQRRLYHSLINYLDAMVGDVVGTFLHA